MRIETNETDLSEVNLIALHAMRQDEIVEIVCDSRDSFDAFVDRLRYDENADDWVVNSGVVEIWGSLDNGSRNPDYRVHVMTRETEMKNLGMD